MPIVFTMPEEIEKHLKAEIGPNLNEAAKVALAVELHREGKLSLGQVAEMLDLSVYQADGLLKQHGVELPYTVADFEHDGAALDRALGE